MSPIHDLFDRGWHRVGQQAQSLLSDVKAEQYVLQPQGVVNHPAWTISHLIHYHPAILSLLQGQAVQDPSDAPNAKIYDEGSTPQPNLSLYRAGDALLKTYMQGHQQIHEALLKASTACFEQKPGLDRWAKAFPTTKDALVYLMLLHESQHLGQLMVWRRVAGLAPLS